MQDFRNYYEILGVARNATGAEVKRAYRQMARRYHPDLNPGDQEAEERFKQIGEAYEVLSDPEKRSEYEEFSSFWNQKGFQGLRGLRRRVEKSGDDFANFSDFNSFIDQLLNRRRAPSPAGANGRTAPEPPPATPDPRTTAWTEPRPEPGQEADPVSAQTESSQAYGAAPQPPRVERTAANRAAPHRTATNGTAANGSRRDAEATLTVPLEKALIGGRERVRLEDGRSLEVNMPPGMFTGQRIRLRGQGIGGGNLYLRIEVEPHAYFQLQGNDVICRLPLTPSEAALGGAIAVPTLDGPVQMNIPPGVQSRRRLRLAGKGYPVGRDRRGDQIVEIDIVVPSVLSDREKALYEELRQVETLNPRADLPV